MQANSASAHGTHRQQFEYTHAVTLTLSLSTCPLFKALQDHEKSLPSHTTTRAQPACCARRDYPDSLHNNF